MKDSLADTSLDILEKKIDALIASCERLKQENCNLKKLQHSLIEKQEKIIAKNSQAKAKLKTIVSQYKTTRQR